MRLFSTLCVSLLTALPVSAQDLTDPDYFPLQVGTKWTYVSAGQPFTLTVVRTEMIDGLKCHRVEAKVNEVIVATEHLFLAKDGLYRLQINGLKPDHPFPLMKFPIATTKGWKIDTKVAGETMTGAFTASKLPEFKVGDSTYTNVLKVNGKVTINDTPTQFTFWFAPKVGLVQQKVESANLEMLIELKEVSFPKAAP